jgi:tagatose 1,6-diphosphate aldolase GatY/KbaY
MLVSTSQLLTRAREGRYAVGAFNVYHLEGVLAVVAAAEALESPVIMQILPAALDLAGTPLISLCLAAGDASAVPVAVHLDHCSSPEIIKSALSNGISSVMADGSRLGYQENLAFTREMATLAGAAGRSVEGELGRLSGSEDGLSVSEIEARLTDPDQAAEFVAETGVDALAVCIGNAHGTYSRPPVLEFDRLEAINRRLSVPLVLHGSSGLPDEAIRRSIASGVCKFNVNTELRSACLAAAGEYLKGAEAPELVRLMAVEIDAMKAPVKAKIRLFGSGGAAI